jgi:hypothetical protein
MRENERLAIQMIDQKLEIEKLQEASRAATENRP